MGQDQKCDLPGLLDQRICGLMPTFSRLSSNVHKCNSSASNRLSRNKILTMSQMPQFVSRPSIYSPVFETSNLLSKGPLLQVIQLLLHIPSAFEKIHKTSKRKTSRGWDCRKLPDRPSWIKLPGCWCQPSVFHYWDLYFVVSVFITNPSNVIVSEGICTDICVMLRTLRTWKQWTEGNVSLWWTRR